MLAAAVQHLTDQPAPPPELPVADKLRWLLDRVVTVVGSGLGTGGVAAVLAADDPEFTAAFRAALDAQLAPLSADVAADARSGRLRADVDGEGLVDLVLGAVLAELLRHGAVRPGWADRTWELLVVATR